MMQQTSAAELLLAIARRFAGIESQEGLRLRASRVTDWSAAMDLARAHGMEPLAAWYLDTDCAGMFAPDFYDRLHATLQRNTANFVLLSTDLIKVLRILRVSRHTGRSAERPRPGNNTVQRNPVARELRPRPAGSPWRRRTG